MPERGFFSSRAAGPRTGMPGFETAIGRVYRKFAFTYIGRSCVVRCGPGAPRQRRL